MAQVYVQAALRIIAQVAIAAVASSLQTIRGPKVGDLAQQTAQEGGPRPITFALSPPMAGNIIASGPTRTVKKKKGGKGGPKVETETIYRSYAVGVCEGPIGRFVRVWRNGQIVWDDSIAENFHDFDGRSAFEYAFRKVTNNEVFIEKARFYTGTFDQMPDPDLEAIFGIGSTPAHRGTAYMVVVDDDLTDMRGAIPQFMFQVENGVTGEAEIIYPVGVWEWQKPEGLLTATVTVIAGGGGGASGGGRRAFIPHSGSGGQGGGYSVEEFDAADLPETVVVNVGAGGTGGDATNGEQYGEIGTDGDDSSFGALLVAEGGDHGTSQNTDGGAEKGAGTTQDGGVGGDADAGPSGATGERGLPGASTSLAGAGGGGGGLPASLTELGPGGYGGQAGDALGGAPGVGEINDDEGATAQGLAGAPGGSADRFGGAGGGGGGGAYAVNGVGIGGEGGQGGDYGGGGGGGAVGVGDSTPNSFGGAGGGGGDGVVIVQQVFEPAIASLAEVITAICERAGLPASLIDVSLITQSCRGFVVTNQYPARDAIRQLAQVYFFDATPADGVLRFIPRGANTVATINEQTFLEDEEDIEQTKRGDPIQVPRVLNFNYWDVDGGIATDKQTSERAGDRRSVGDAQMQTSAIFSANEAARVVRISHQVVIEDQRGELHFQLPDQYIALTPADTVFLQWEGQTVRARLTKVEIFDGYQKYTALRDRQSSYVSSVEGYPASPSQFPASQSVGPTLIRPLDIPLQRDTDDGLGLVLYLAVSGVDEAWQGATVELSYDGGANYIESGSVEVSTTMGEILADLPDHPQTYPDTQHTITVRIDTPDAELESSTLAGMLNRVNRAVIAGVEVIQFAEAEEVSPGIWELSHLLRGRQGTATQLHVSGSRFSLLDSYTTVPMAVTDVGRTLTFRATSYGASPETATVISIHYTGVSQTERPPGYVSARRAGSNVVVEWQGVGRLGGGAQAAHGARFDGYRVTFSDGIAPDVVVDTDAQTITQAVGGFASPLTITVQQLNALTGAGPVTEVLLT